MSHGRYCWGPGYICLIILPYPRTSGFHLQQPDEAVLCIFTCDCLNGEDNNDYQVAPYLITLQNVTCLLLACLASPSCSLPKCSYFWASFTLFCPERLTHSSSYWKILVETFLQFPTWFLNTWKCFPQWSVIIEFMFRVHIFLKKKCTFFLCKSVFYVTPLCKGHVMYKSYKWKCECQHANLVTTVNWDINREVKYRKHFFEAGKIDQGRQEKICFDAWDLVFCQTQEKQIIILTL